MDKALKLTVLPLLLIGTWARAQLRPWPQGMYCGGNQLVFEGALRASKVEGVVLFYDRSAVVPGARVQVQVKGRTDILLELTADSKGRFKVPNLHPGEYWLGISSRGLNLHYWDLNIDRRSSTKKVQVALSLGT